MESCCWRESKTLNIEITAYALLTLLSKQNDSDCLPILKWLLNQRNDQGGFEGTQDTIVGIEALAKFATKITTKENNVKIEIATNGNKYNFNVNKDNALVLQSQKVCHTDILRNKFTVYMKISFHSNRSGIHVVFFFFSVSNSWRQMQNQLA